MNHGIEVEKYVIYLWIKNKTKQAKPKTKNTKEANLHKINPFLILCSWVIDTPVDIKHRAGHPIWNPHAHYYWNVRGCGSLPLCIISLWNAFYILYGWAGDNYLETQTLIISYTVIEKKIHLRNSFLPTLSQISNRYSNEKKAETYPVRI